MGAVAERLFIVKVQIKVDSTKKPTIVLREQSGECKLLMDAPGKATTLEMRDVSRCTDPFNYTLFVDFPEESTQEGKTKCEQMADKAGAYKTQDATTSMQPIGTNVVHIV